MRQSGADDDQRRARLRQLMAGRAERGDVVGLQVLDLVDEQCDAGADVRGQLGDVGEQLDEVDLDVAGVGASLRGRDVDARLPSVPQLRVGLVGPERERLEHAEHFLDPVRRPVSHGQVPDRPVQCRRQRPSQLGVRPCFDLPGTPLVLDGHRPQLAEQHGLSHATQSRQHQAALGTAARHAFEHDLERMQLALAPRQLGRPLPGARREGVADGVHSAKLSACLASARYSGIHA